MDNPRSWTKDETIMYLYNPLSDDFTTKMRDDKNVETTYTIPAFDMVSFPSYLGKQIKKDLMNTIFNVRTIAFPSPQQTAEVDEEIDIKI